MSLSVQPLVLRAGRRRSQAVRPTANRPLSSGLERRPPVPAMLVLAPRRMCGSDASECRHARSRRRRAARSNARASCRPGFPRVPPGSADRLTTRPPPILAASSPARTDSRLRAASKRRTSSGLAAAGGEPPTGVKAPVARHLGDPDRAGHALGADPQPQQLAGRDVAAEHTAGNVDRAAPAAAGRLDVQPNLGGDDEVDLGRAGRFGRAGS